MQLKTENKVLVQAKCGLMFASCRPMLPRVNGLCLYGGQRLQRNSATSRHPL